MKSWISKLKQNFDSRINLKRASINSSWLLMEQMVRLCVGFIMSIAITRYLGPTGLGIFSYANSWVAMFTSFSILGVDTIAVKKMVEDKEQSNSILGSVLLLKIIGSILAFILSVSTVFVFGTHDSRIFSTIFILSLSFLFQPSVIVDLYYQSRFRISYPISVRIIAYLLVNVLKSICIYYSLDLSVFAIIVVSEMIFTSIGYFILFNFYEKLKFDFDIDKLKTLFITSLPVFISLIVVGINTKIDQIVVGRLLGNEVLGHFSLAIALVQMVYFIPSVLMLSIFPILVSEKTKLNHLSYISKTKKSLQYLIIIAAILILFANLFSKYIILFLYGDGFVSSVKLFNLYSFNILPVFGSYVFTYWFIIENKQNVILTFQTISLIVNFVLLYFFTNLFGVVGAIVTGLVVNLLLFISYLVYYNNYLNIKLYGNR